MHSLAIFHVGWERSSLVLTPHDGLCQIKARSSGESQRRLVSSTDFEIDGQVEHEVVQESQCVQQLGWCKADNGGGIEKPLKLLLVLQEGRGPGPECTNPDVK